MNKLLLIIKQEFITVVRRKSFILTLVLIPLGAFLIMGIVDLIKQSEESGSGSNILSGLLMPAQSSLKEGFVDESGLIQLFPPEAQAELIRFDDRSDALNALKAGEITSYFILPKEYLQSGEIYNIRQDFSPLSSMGTSSVFTNLVEYNLMGGDTKIGGRVANPAAITTVNLAPEPEKKGGTVMSFLVPYLVALLFYLVILGSASLMLSSVSKEKVNRMMEIMMTSITPRQMLTGKIIALGLAGLLQTVVWTVSGYFLLGMGGSVFSLGKLFHLSPSFIAWGVLFFLGGYGLYASLLGGVGALVPSLREAAQATTIIILPMVIPLALIGPVISDPNGSLATFLSLFPFTSPVTMMTRLAATSVPFWQIPLSLVILFATVVFVVRGIANVFRAQNLLSGQTFKIKTFVKTLLGKV